MSDLSKRLRDVVSHDNYKRSDVDRFHDLLHEAADALDARGWQPIETAPRDGSWVWLYRPPSSLGTWDRIVLARWVGAFAGYTVNAWCWADSAFDHTRPEEEFLARVAEESVFEDQTNFTHWMPLPAPPEQEGV